MDYERSNQSLGVAMHRFDFSTTARTADSSSKNAGNNSSDAQRNAFRRRDVRLLRPPQFTSKADS